MVVFCPITSNTKYYPSHYLLEDTKKINGAVLCEHIRSIDYEATNVKYVETASLNDFTNFLELIVAYL